MNTAIPEVTAATELPQIKVPKALARRPSQWAGWFSALVSLAQLAMIVSYFRDMSLNQIAHMIPASSLFWALFALYYLAGPVSEWIIYRKLWHIPLSGIGALLRKLVSNEILLGYLGEAQFYAWARSRTRMTTAPFGTIKDVTILSALTGNVATLVMLVFAWPLVWSEAAGLEMKSAFVSLGVVLVSSMAILLFRSRLFSLPRKDLAFIAGMHTGRIMLMLGLAALMWHHVLPGVALWLWLVLATLRMLVSRLPLLPNKDVVFAGLAVYLMGHDVAIGDLMAMMAAILLVAHLAVGTVFGLADLISTRKAEVDR
jgi:hypothetical protein